MLERQVPRYTSYPTAPHFTSAVDARIFGTWLQSLPADAALSLYLHVPYCRVLCHYCGCHTKATLRDEPIEAYAQTLVNEVALVAQRATTRKVAHIHWGGGTPSILGEDLLRFVADEIATRFDLSALHEHAIELDPRYVTAPLASALRAIGVNRTSLGVQDFTPRVQEAAGRVQPFEAVKGAVGLLNDAGINRINIDLMYGLPKQTADDVRRTVTLAHSLQPQRVAVFGYAHVPWFRPQQRLIADADLPTSDERLAQAAAAHETLVALGYRPIGLDHYAQPDDKLAAKGSRVLRNFQGYTDDDADALLGLGASAISRLPQGFAQNAPAVGNYSRAIAEGKLATAKGIALTDDDRRRGHVIERLMCDMAVDLDAVAGDDFADELAALQPFRDNGSIEITGRRIRVTDQGRPYLRLVASAFDAYLGHTQSRHSVAI